LKIMSTTEESVEKWDAEAVASAASAKLVAEGGVAGVEAGRAHFVQVLFAWEDDVEQSKNAEAIIELWLRYASFERSLKQFKKAVQVFESAAASPVASRSPRIWLEYASFCQERGKLENANLVYQRAVETLPNESNLWDAYLSFRTQVLGENISLHQLKSGDTPMDENTEQPSSTNEEENVLSRKRPREDEEDKNPSIEDNTKMLIDFTVDLPQKQLSSIEVIPQETTINDDEEVSYDPTSGHDKIEIRAHSLFGDEPITEEEANLDGLDSAQTQAFIRFVREPTAVDLVEALRLTDMLATAEIEETWAALRYHQAARLRAVAHSPDECTALISAIRAENASLSRRTSTELQNLYNDIQSALKNAGLPLPSGDIKYQRRIVRAVLASNRQNGRESAPRTSNTMEHLKPPAQFHSGGGGFPPPQNYPPTYHPLIMSSGGHNIQL